MVALSNGLVVSPAITSSMVASLDLKFEPSVGIMARKYRKFGMDIRSFHEPLKRSIQQVVIPSIQANFAAEGRPSWEPLAEATVRKRKSDHPILNDTGALARTMGQFNIWTVDRDKALLTDLPDAVWYGKVQQAGLGGGVKSLKNVSTGKTTQVSSGDGIPARPFVMFQPDDPEKIDKVFLLWLEERALAAGLVLT